MAAGKGVAFRLPLDLLLSLFALYPVMSSVLREKASVLFVGMASAAEAGLAVYYVLCSVSVLGLPPEEVTMCLAALVAAFIAGIFIYGVSRRLADVRSVMASGNAWSYMCLIVETVYLFASWSVRFLCFACSVWTVMLQWLCASFRFFSVLCSWLWG